MVETHVSTKTTTGGVLVIVGAHEVTPRKCSK
jgi:hypothetical protein